MTKSEVDAIKTLFSPAPAQSNSLSTAAATDGANAPAAHKGMRLLGFFPLSQLPRDLNVDEPYFLFPSDRDIAGTLIKVIPRREI